MPYSYSKSIGDKIAVRFGGDFYYPESDVQDQAHEILLIAGGVGINPLISILLQIAEDMKLDKSYCQKLHLIFSAKTSKELLFKETIEKILQEYPDKISADFIVTRESDQRVTKKMVEHTLLTQFGLDFGQKRLLCYSCGPPKMIEDTNGFLLSLGIPKDNIKYELWW